MEGESGVTQSIIDVLRCSDFERDQMECESGVTRSIIDEIHASDIQEDQMVGAGGFTRSIIDKFILGISKEINCKVKVVVLEVSLMNFILGIAKGTK